MRKPLVGLVLAFTLVFPSPAWAQTVSRHATGFPGRDLVLRDWRIEDSDDPLPRKTPTSRIVMINLGTKFDSIDSLCFHFTFKRDLLDDGDSLVVYLGSPGQPQGGGFGPGGGGGLTNISTCFTAEHHEIIVGEFLDGRQIVVLEATSGSVIIDDIVVTATGS
jgi:hypothetical protein